MRIDANVGGSEESGAVWEVCPGESVADSKFTRLVPEWEPRPDVRVTTGSRRFQADVVCCPVVNTCQGLLLSSGQPPSGAATRFGCACGFHEDRVDCSENKRILQSVPVNVAETTRRWR